MTARTARRALSLALVVLVAVPVVSTSAAADPLAGPTAEPTASGSARPRVLLLGDSTMAAAVWYDGQGVTHAGDVLRERFDIDLDAESCRRIIHRSCTGFDRITGGRYVPPNVLDEMRMRRGQSFDALVLMAGYDEFDLGPAVPAVMDEAARLGIERVYWLTFRTTTSYYLPGRVSAAGLYERLNGQLREQARDYPSLEILEWDEATKNHCNQSRNPGSTLPGTGATVPIQCWFWWDGIHMTPDGAEGLMGWIRDQLTERGLGRCVGGTGEPVTAAGTGAAAPAAGFTPTEPVRVLDTRGATPLAPDTRRVVALTPPDGARAAVVTVTAHEPCGDGFVSALPCSAGAPTTSTVNATAGQTTANTAIVPLDGSGVCVYGSMQTDLSVDLQGWFTDDGDRFGSVGPHRALDTRGGERLRAGVERAVSLAPWVGDDATAAWLSVTAVGPTGRGEVAAHRCGAAGLGVVQVDGNVDLTSIVSGTALTAVSGAQVCLTSTVDTDVVVDVFGAFSPSGTQRYVAAPPARVLDTRASGQLVGAGASVPWTTAGPADVVNVTLVGPWGDGYVTVHPCGSLPLVSNANASAFAIVPTLAVATSGDGGACATASVPAHLVVDRMGWFTT